MRPPPRGAVNHDKEQDSARRHHGGSGRLRVGPVRRRPVAGRRGPKEAARRESVKAPAKVVTNNDSRAVAPACYPPRPATPPPSRQPPREARRLRRRPRSLRKRPTRPRTRRNRRKRISDARQARDHNAFLLEAIQSRINALTTDFSARDDPFQRPRLRSPPEGDCRTRAHGEDSGGAEQKISTSRRSRRANVPPGWLR